MVHPPSTFATGRDPHLVYLGRLVRALRESRRLSATQVAIDLDMGYQTVYNLEHGQAINARAYPRLARYFGVSLDTLFGMAYDMTDGVPALPPLDTLPAPG